MIKGRLKIPIFIPKGIAGPPLGILRVGGYNEIRSIHVITIGSMSSYCLTYGI